MQQGNTIPYLKYLLESFQSYAESKSIDLEFQCETDDLFMDFDADRINSIVTNLISNAIKFTPEGGKVALFCRNETGEKEQLVVEVRDNGLGIPKDKLGNIFDRFYQVDDSNTRPGEGTGIGLTLTHDLVESFGGAISVESEDGNGSLFRVSLPVTRQAPLRQAIPSRIDRQREEGGTVMLHPEEDGPVGTAPYRLLIVEDNADVVQYLRTCLSESYQLLIAKDGQEGIDMAIAEVPDIILSDVMMPNKDGFELCQTLKDDDRTSHIPIVLLTAKSDMESRISGLEHGADAYLPKPFERKELLVQLESLIRLRQRLQARYQGLELEVPENTSIQKEDAFIQKLRSLIHERLDDPELNVATLCELAGMSRSQLHNKVKALTGLSSSRFLRQVRLLEAKKLLRDTDLHISEVAYLCGFNDPAYFSRMFVDEFELTPSAFRKD
ncbi:MAG: ATP-binding protein [Bacteroidia bacterium]